MGVSGGDQYAGGQSGRLVSIQRPSTLTLVNLALSPPGVSLKLLISLIDR